MDSQIYMIFLTSLQFFVQSKGQTYKLNVSDINPSRLVFTVINVSSIEGETTQIACRYHSSKSRTSQKHLCRGKDPTMCLEQGLLEGERFSLMDSVANQAVTMTISDPRAKDAGIYWCLETTVSGETKFTAAVHLTVLKGGFIIIIMFEYVNMLFCLY